MRIKLTIAAAVLLVTVVLVSGVVAANSSAGRLPWVDEDGIGDMSKYPAIQEVLDRTGAVVGTVETKYLETSQKIPVTGADGQIVGHFGPDGYWALGESKPVIEGKVTIVEVTCPPPKLIQV